MAMHRVKKKQRSNTMLISMQLFSGGSIRLAAVDTQITSSCSFY